MLSLMSAAALIPFASPGSDQFIALSVMLALMVGVLRLFLGAFRLGAIVNLLSTPVIVGFTNAAALIIGLSQFSKVIGVPFPRTDSYLLDLWRVVTQVPQLHWATLAFALGAWLVIAGLRRVAPALPGVLIAVVLATVASKLVGFEDRTSISADQIEHAPLLATVEAFDNARTRIDRLTTEIAEVSRRAERLEQRGGHDAIKEAAGLRAQAAVLKYELKRLKSENTLRRVEMHATPLRAVPGPDGELDFRAAAELPADIEHEPGLWRFSNVDNGTIVLSAGGAVVGDIPQGLPSLEVPEMEWSLVPALLPAALVMALIGFMEATSISRALAAQSREKLDSNQELIGQGLANIVGSFFQSYTVSGSFSRSAVAAKSGARTGFYAIISAVGVVLTMLFLTDSFYHLPQPVLAAIVMSAVFSLIDFRTLRHAWNVRRSDGVVGALTFAATLWMAPQLASGVLVGVVLTVLVFLHGVMQPRSEILGKTRDGSLAGAISHDLPPISEHYVALRFDASLVFINSAYFEEAVMKALAQFPKARAVLVIGDGINRIDATGEEKLRALTRDLKSAGVTLMFSGLKKQVREALVRAGLDEAVGTENLFPGRDLALAALARRYDLQAA
jgi:MFS superfamily sulfate permease-like transporter